MNQYFLPKQVAAHLNHLVYLQRRRVLIRVTVGMTMNQKKMIKKKKMTTMMTMQKLNFLLKWENIKNLNIFDFISRIMNNQEINKIQNLMTRYHIENTEENFERLKLLIKQKETLLYSEVFDLADNCRIIKKTSKNIIIEIDSEEYGDLLDDINKHLFIKKINQRRSEQKIGLEYVQGNLFITLVIDA